eukprot:scaffold29810_cov35-Phaeocystis_antarctica.AAC.1
MYHSLIGETLNKLIQLRVHCLHLLALLVELAVDQLALFFCRLTKVLGRVALQCGARLALHAKVLGYVALHAGAPALLLRHVVLVVAYVLRDLFCKRCDGLFEQTRLFEHPHGGQLHLEGKVSPTVV